MKRKFAWLIILSLMLSLIPTMTDAIEVKEGEMLITSDPIQSTVGEIVKVDFYCYSNIPEGEFMDSLQFSLTYDSELLTFGSLNLHDDEQNLKSILYGKSAQPPMLNTKEPGAIILAWSEPFGTDEQGFLFQIEFRVEQEGAGTFFFNSVQYSTIDANDQSVSYYIQPLQTGGVFTEGYEVPVDSDPDATFAPLEPVVETPKPQNTATPVPSNNGHGVPQTSTLPVPSDLPTSNPTSSAATPSATAKPKNSPTASAHTATASATAAPQSVAPQTDSLNTDVPNTNQASVDNPTDAPIDPDSQFEETAVPVPVAETTDAPIDDKTAQPTDEPENPNPELPLNRALVIAIIAGIIVVILLAILAIILVLVHNKKQRERD